MEEKIIKWCNDNGLIFEEIVGGYKKRTEKNIKLKCLQCDNEIITSWATLRLGIKGICKDCMKKIRREMYATSKEEVINYINSLGFTLISEYINNREKITIRHNECGYVFECSYGNFKKEKHKCPKCATKSTSDKFRFTDDFVNSYLKDFGYKKTSSYINTDSLLELECPEGHKFNMDFYHFKNRNQRCPICYKNKDMKAENSPSWKGGKTSIDRSLRNFVGSWRKSMLSKAEYKCEITGRNDEELDVHHTYPFYKIVEEVLLELNLPLKQKIHEYDKEEIDKIKSLLISKHEEYDCGFVLCKTLHLLFHKLYGKVNTSEEDLKEFIDRYNKGEFNN